MSSSAPGTNSCTQKTDTKEPAPIATNAYEMQATTAMGRRAIGWVNPARVNARPYTPAATAHVLTVTSVQKPGNQAQRAGQLLGQRGQDALGIEPPHIGLAKIREPDRSMSDANRVAPLTVELLGNLVRRWIDSRDWVFE